MHRLLASLVLFCVVSGCRIAPAGKISVDSRGVIEGDAVWTAIKGSILYASSESRPDGTFRKVSITIQGDTNIDGATQAEIAKTTAITNAVRDGVKSTMDLAKEVADEYFRKPSTAPAK